MSKELGYVNYQECLVQEYRDDPPTVPTYEHVDVGGLTAGDPNPLFLTLPIGKVNSTSLNGRFYGEEFITEMEKQVRERGSMGIMGHVPAKDKGTQFPPEAVFWIGTARKDDLVWGKGYIPPGEQRDRILRYQATRMKLGTSIDANADSVWDPSIKAFRMKHEGFKLNQIDIGPHDRIGIPDLAAVPLITQEMLEDLEQEQEMGKEQIIQELTAEDADSLPDVVKNELREESLQEFRTLLNVPDGGDVFAAIRALQVANSNNSKEAISNRIRELASDSTNGIKVVSVREIVQELVQAKNPKTIQEAENAYTEIAGSDRIKDLLKSTVQEMMGPNQGNQSQSQTTQTNGKRKSEHFVYPE